MIQACWQALSTEQWVTTVWQCGRATAGCQSQTHILSSMKCNLTFYTPRPTPGIYGRIYDVLQRPVPTLMFVRRILQSHELTENSYIAPKFWNDRSHAAYDAQRWIHISNYLHTNIYLVWTKYEAGTRNIFGPVFIRAFLWLLQKNLAKKFGPLF